MRNIIFALPLLTLLACSHDDKEDIDTATCPTDTALETDDTAQFTEYFTCTDSTGTYNVGDTWTCPDGCNTCGCLEQDVIASTNMACSDTGAGDTGTDTGSGGTDTSTP